MKRKAYETPNVTRSVILMEDGVMAGSLTENKLETTKVEVSVFKAAQDGFNDDPDAGFNSIGF